MKTICKFLILILSSLCTLACYFIVKDLLYFDADEYFLSNSTEQVLRACTMFLLLLIAIIVIVFLVGIHKDLTKENE